MVEVSASLVLALIAAGFSQRAALDLAGIARSTWHYRDHPRARVSEPVAHRQRRTQCWLSKDERDQITVKIQTAFAAGKSVYQAFYDALDAGDPVASLSTWYRIARAVDQTTRPIRRTRKHRATAMPTLLVDGPDQAWSWDITHLRGPYRGVSYQLYLAMDVFSRMVTGWRVETREDDDLAAEMFEQAFTVRGVLPRIIHSDGGPSMTSRTLGDLFAELGIATSRNRPRVSNDNPYSESLFKTAKSPPTTQRSSPTSTTPGPGRPTSSRATTTATTTPAWRATPPTTSTTAPGPVSTIGAKPPWTASTPPTPNGSPTRPEYRPPWPKWPSTKKPTATDSTQVDRFRDDNASSSRGRVQRLADEPGRSPTVPTTVARRAARRSTARTAGPRTTTATALVIARMVSQPPVEVSSV